MTWTVLTSVGFLIVTAITFIVWLRAPRPGSVFAEWYPLLAALTGVFFFLACFSLGVWFSILRLRGEFWKL